MLDYGMFMKNIRKVKNVTLQSLANKLDVSVSFLSLLENGKKQIPLEYVNRISDALNLNDDEKKQLENSILISNKKMIIELDNLSNNQIEVSLLFASTIDELNEQQVNEIKNIIKGDN